jgi:hypothetical protein
MRMSGSSHFETIVKPPPGFKIPTRAEMISSRFQQVDRDIEGDDDKEGEEEELR